MGIEGTEDVVDLQMGNEDVSRCMCLPCPEGYTWGRKFPHPFFEVAEVYSGAGTCAPNFGTRYSFSSEDQARAYVDYARGRGFCGVLRLVRWDRHSGFGETGACLEEFHKGIR